MYCLIFCSICQPNSNLVYFYRDATLVQYMPSSCVSRCGVDVAYWQLSDWTHLQWALHNYHTQRVSAFSAIKSGNTALSNDFREDLFYIVTHTIFTASPIVFFSGNSPLI